MQNFKPRAPKTSAAGGGDASDITARRQKAVEALGRSKDTVAKLDNALRNTESALEAQQQSAIQTQQAAQKIIERMMGGHCSC